MNYQTISAMVTQMRKFILTIFFISVSVLANSQNFDFLPSQPTGMVNDYADMLSTNEEYNLEQKLRSYRDTTSNVIVIAIINSLEGYSREEVATELMNNWRIWEGERYNGVLILISKTDRELKIEIGYGLEGAIPDAMANRIVQDILIPNLRNGSVYQGLDNATNAIIQLASGEYEGVGKNYGRSSNTNNDFPVDVLIIIGIIIIYLVSKGGKPRGGKRTIGADDVIEAIFWSQIFGGSRSRGSSFGGGGFGGGSSFGGFSGGGGFGSGGGGAGGSW